MRRLSFIGPFLLLLFADPALATQRHGGPEGIYVHQLGHLFFAVSMALFAIRLKEKKLVHHSGWRFIRLAALFFIFWNVDTIIIHLLEDQFEWVIPSHPTFSSLHLDVSAGGRSAGILYFLVKHDHLLAVPAMICLFLGLLQLARHPEAMEVER